MSLSFKENNESNQSYLKLEIYQSQICQSIKPPLPYGLSILFDNFKENQIESIEKENEVLKYPGNQFIYILNNNTSQNDLIGKEIIINSYTTSIFIIKKNFASVKIPILYSKTNNQKQWFFLKDINDNICIKILISIEIFLSNKLINNFNNSNDILKQNNETIKENKTYKNKSNNNYMNAINYNNKKPKDNNIINNHNTYIVSTNYNSASGNSLLNITNNIYLKTINNNSNNINNLNINFPFNFSPIPLFGKSNSFFIDSVNEKDKDNNNIHIKKESFKSLIDNKSKILENEELQLISENDGDSKMLKENAIYSGELSNNEIISDSKNEAIQNNENILDKINTLISEKNEEISDRQKAYTINYNNYLKDKKNSSKMLNILERENEKIKNNRKIIEKSEQIYENKTLNLNENILNFAKELERKNIQKELDEYERNIISNINEISFYFIEPKNFLNNIKIGETNQYINFLKLNRQYNIEIKAKNKINSLSKKLSNNPIFTKKLNLPNQIKGRISNEIESNREINHINKKYSPINYTLKDFNSKLSLSISNSDQINEEDNNDINNKSKKNYKNKNDELKNNKNKKYADIFRDYFCDNLDKKEFRKKPSKSNLTKGKLKLKIPFNCNSVNNIETKYSLTKNIFHKNSLIIKTNSNNTSNNNNTSNKSITINNKPKRKISNLNSKDIRKDKNLFKSKYNNSNIKKSNTSVDKKYISIDNKSLNITINTKLSLEKNNNLCKRKLNKKEKNKYNKKSFNNETFRYLNNHKNYFKGNPILISNNNNYLEYESIFSKNYNNTEIELNKNKNKIIRRKIKNKTVNINLNLNTNESYIKKSENSLNIPRKLLIINKEKNCKKFINEINYNKKVALTHTYSRPICININNKDNKMNDGILENKKNKKKTKIKANAINL